MNVLNKLSLSNWNNITKTTNHYDVLLSALRLCVSREDIAKFPFEHFKGKVHVISCDKDENSYHTKNALDLITKSSVVGFDTETAVTFNRNIDPLPVALVQIAIPDHAVLWRLRRQRKFLFKSDFPPVLKSILTSSNIKKIGTGSYGDIKELYSQYNVAVENVEDTQTIAKELGFSKIGLASLTAQLFGWRVSKDRQLSNWEAYKLDRKQINYAATDAWASLLIYNELMKILKSLQVQRNKKVKVTTAFQQIMRTEAKLDADILRILEKQRNEILMQNTKSSEMDAISWSVEDYQISPYVSLCKQRLKEEEKEIARHIQNFYSYQDTDNVTACKSPQPFLYQPMM